MRHRIGHPRQQRRVGVLGGVCVQDAGYAAHGVTSGIDPRRAALDQAPDTEPDARQQASRSGTVADAAREKLPLIAKPDWLF
jgi:hypothetical protein